MKNVYLICAEIDGIKLHKIGYTRRKIEERIKEFETGNASDIYIIDSFKSKWGSKIEAGLHKIFRNKRIRGEWFLLNEDDILKFKKYCENSHNNFELISTYNTYYLEKNKI